MQVTSLRRNSCTALGIHLLSTPLESRRQPMVSWRDTAMVTQHSSWKEVRSLHVRVVSVFFPTSLWGSYFSLGCAAPSTTTAPRPTPTSAQAAPHHRMTPLRRKPQHSTSHHDTPLHATATPQHDPATPPRHTTPHYTTLHHTTPRSTASRHPAPARGGLLGAGARRAAVPVCHAPDGNSWRRLLGVRPD